MKRIVALTVITGLLLMTAVPTVRYLQKVQAYHQSLAGGALLAATPRMRNSVFENTRVLLLSVSEQGVTGLALRKPIVPEDVFEPVDMGEIFWGGPVAPNKFAVISRTSHPLLRPVAETGLLAQVVLPRELTEQVVAQTQDQTIFSGYVGWDLEQLEKEISYGQWRVYAADSLQVRRVVTGFE